MVVYEMATLALPYEEVNLLDVRAHILANNLPRIPDSLAEPLRVLLTACLTLDPGERPSA